MQQEGRGLVGGIQRFSTSDGPGIRTTVFLKGCPLACMWCHNPELIDPHQQLMRSVTKCIGCGYCQEVCPRRAILMGQDGYYVDRALCDNCLACVDACTAGAMSPAGEWMTAEQVMETVRKDRGYYDKSGGGLTISGGELLMQRAFSERLLDLASDEGIGVCLDTSGCGDGDALFRMAGKADWLLYDMKCIIPEEHKKYTGLDNRVILKNLMRLAADPERRKKLWMRMPLIHGVNDTEEVILRTRDFYRDNGISKVTMLAYHELGKNKCRGIGTEFHAFAPPPHERMLEILGLFREIGMDAEILGEEIA